MPSSLFSGGVLREAKVTDYFSGLVHGLQSWQVAWGGGGAIDVTQVTYAHRPMPSLLFQDIKVKFE